MKVKFNLSSEESEKFNVFFSLCISEFESCVNEKCRELFKKYSISGYDDFNFVMNVDIFIPSELDKILESK